MIRKLFIAFVIMTLVLAGGCGPEQVIPPSG